MVLNLTLEEFESAATEIVGRVVAEAQITMQRKLQAAGFVLTGDLLNSMRHESLVIGRDLYAEMSLGFAGYGRFKDMRKLLYNKMPPIEVLEDYVREIGLDNFKYVPGYLLGARYRTLHIPESRAINRIAWGIAVNRLHLGSATRSKAKAFYNPVRGRLIYDMANQLLETLPTPILRAMKEQLEQA
ncbi:hypothetical protein ACAW74_04920 [Fibrella sp. WM1]|uniref:hypothetical protein n=1 Tax=Fibrella musci TaxID=3242485 RepID=UPI00352043C6